MIILVCKYCRARFTPAELMEMDVINLRDHFRKEHNMPYFEINFWDIMNMFTVLP